MKKIMISAAASALIPTAAWATVDEYKDGDTTLVANQDGFAIEVRGVNDAGNSVRVYIRPRNGNCVTANQEQVTYEGYHAVDGIPMMQGGVSDFDWTATLHNNPMCSTDKWGWFSLDYIGYGTDTVVLHGTLKSYKIEVTSQANYKGTGKTVITKLRTFH